jgi:hypothetical protein
VVPYNGNFYPQMTILRLKSGSFFLKVTHKIKHLPWSDPNPPFATNGFRITFISFGLVLLFTIHLIFLMPTGKERMETGDKRTGLEDCAGVLASVQRLY